MCVKAYVSCYPLPLGKPVDSGAWKVKTDLKIFTSVFVVLINLLAG